MRVRLDGFRRADAAIMAGVLSDPQTAHWLSSVPQSYGAAEAHAFIADSGVDDHAIRIDGALAGSVRGGDWLGYWVAPPFRRKGVARRAAILALTRSFAAGRNQVQAQCHPDNRASLALLDQLGFTDPRPGTIFSERLQAEQPSLCLTLDRDSFAARHGLTIRTDRLTLNAVTAADLPALHAIATRPEVARMLFVFAPGMPMDDFAHHFPLQALLPPMRLAIRHDGQLIGSIGIGALDSEGGPPVYYFLSPDSWGRGFGRELLNGFLTEIDDRFDLPAIQAEVFDDNPASARLLEAVGFGLIGPRMLRSAGRGGDLAPGRAFQRLRP